MFFSFSSFKTFPHTGCIFSSCLPTLAKLPAHRKFTGFSTLSQLDKAALRS
jgi:hypothetical protein